MSKNDDKKPTDNPGRPPAGPHAKPSLTDPEKTPGSGMVPKPGTSKVEAPTG